MNRVTFQLLAVSSEPLQKSVLIPAAFYVYWFRFPITKVSYIHSFTGKTYLFQNSLDPIGPRGGVNRIRDIFSVRNQN